MSRYGLSKREYDRLTNLINNDILACQSCLVTDLMLNEAYEDDSLINAYTDLSDEMEEVDDEIMEIEDKISVLEVEYEDLEEEQVENEEDDANLVKKMEKIEKEIEELNKEKYNLEDKLSDLDQEHNQPQDPYEWWLITGWLKDKLEELGEVILDNDYGTWWGRCTSGQAIELDYIMHKLAKDLVRKWG